MLNVIGLRKVYGPKTIFDNISFSVEDKDHVGLIGKNGIGKSTIFNFLIKSDNDYSGEIILKRGVTIVKSNQEFYLDSELTPLDFILNSVPRFRELHDAIKKYENDPSHDMEEIEEFSQAINTFHELSYHNIEQDILNSLSKFGIGIDQVISPMLNLSGGEKRFVDLVRIIFSKADLILLDEPTNDMDYVGKQFFIDWLDSYKGTVMIISHDRDVLCHVNKMIELKENEAITYSGKYIDYLKKNSNNTLSHINEYERELKLLEDYHKKREYFYSRKAYGGNDKVQYEKYKKLYDELKESIVKPSFWIDQKTLGLMDKKVIDKYNLFKSKTIEIKNSNTEEINDKSILLEYSEVDLGYNETILANISFKLFGGERLELRGRNGTGKTTLVRSIQDIVLKNNSTIIRNGKFSMHPKIKLGVFEQQLDPEILDFTLGQYIRYLLDQNKIIVNDQKISQVLSTNLFDPLTDKDLKIINCSGGQKARLVILKMLINNPNLIILDEPTNHFDLPSIEQLENMLGNYNGAVIYVSHDELFRKFMGGKILNLGTHSMKINKL